MKVGFVLDLYKFLRRVNAESSCPGCKDWNKCVGCEAEELANTMEKEESL